jgi:hypothetical protein
MKSESGPHRTDRVFGRPGRKGQFGSGWKHRNVGETSPSLSKPEIEQKPQAPRFSAQSGTCRGCAEVRAASGDPTALCGIHLQVATGG